MQRGATLLSVEIDRARAAAVRELFAERPDVEIRAGDWQEVLPGRPPYASSLTNSTVPPQFGQT